jgi:hypothetical protein
MSDKLEWLDRTLLRMPYVTLCLNEKQYLRAVKHLKCPSHNKWLEEYHAACVHTLESEGKTCCVACLRIDPSRTPLEVVGSLAHESVHVWQAYLDQIGERRAGAEIEAYGIQNILSVLLDSYVKQTQGK